MTDPATIKSCLSPSHQSHLPNKDYPYQGVKHLFVVSVTSQNQFGVTRTALARSSHLSEMPRE